MRKTNVLSNPNCVFNPHRKLLPNVSDKGRPFQNQEDGQLKIGKKMMQTASLAARETMAASQ